METFFPLRLAVVGAVVLASGAAVAQDVVTPLGGGLYRAEFQAPLGDWGLGPDGEAVPPDSATVAVVYGSEAAVTPVVEVAVEAERNRLRYQYRVGNGPEGPRALYGVDVLAEAPASDRRAPDTTWRAGVLSAWDGERMVETTHYTWAQTLNYNETQTAYLPLSLEPGAALDGFSLLSAGLPAIVEGRARALRYLVPEDTTAAVYERWSVAQVVNLSRTPHLDRLRAETGHVAFRTLGPRDVPDPFSGPVFLDTLAADVVEGDGLGWLGAVGPRVGGLLAEARAAWAAGDLASAAEVVSAAAILTGGDATVTTEGRALVGLNAAFLLDRLPAPPVNPHGEPETGRGVPAVVAPTDAALPLAFVSSAPPDDDPIRRAVALADPLGAVLGAGLDTTDVGALADAVRSGPTWVAGQTALYLGLRREGAAADAMLERLSRADAAGPDVAMVADLLYGLYLVAAPDARAAAAAVADSLSQGLYPSGGTVSSMAYGAALDVLLALGDRSQLPTIADSARAGCAACAYYLAEIVAADSSLYPTAERALLDALGAGRLAVWEVLSAGAIEPTPAAEAVMFRVLDTPDRQAEHFDAIVWLSARPGALGRPLRGQPLADRLETLLTADTTGGWHREPFAGLDDALGVPESHATRVLKLATGSRDPLAIRLAERAAFGAFGSAIAEAARNVLSARRLDRAPRCGARPATVFVSPGLLVTGGPADGQPYAGVLRGTDGPDVLAGTDGPDVILGLGGDDVVCGFGGDDTVSGGDGTDWADGGDGTDRCDAETAACELDAFDLPAALVATGGPVAFRGTAFAVSGAAHDLSGAPTDGPGVPAVVAPTDAALAAVLGALSGRQRARLDGGAEAAPLVISPESWAETLAARADVTLGDRPGSVGSASAPVIAYAPAGARLDGSFEGVGVLVVDGPLAMRGNARWTGLVIARDGLDVSGSALVVGGAVVTGGLAVGGSAELLYSPAALSLARAAAVAE